MLSTNKLYIVGQMAVILFLGMGQQSFASGVYLVDSKRTFVEFRIENLGINWVVGTFDKVTGNFAFDPKFKAAPTVSIVIDTTSIDTSYAGRNKTLQSSALLDVKKFPQATFISRGFKREASGGMITGDLMLHGVTKSVTFHVSPVMTGLAPDGGNRAGFKGHFTFDRRDFGMDKPLLPMTWNINMVFSVEGIRQTVPFKTVPIP